MIISFKERGTEDIFDGENTKLARKTLQSLSLPGLHLEKLKGSRAGQHSIRINDQYRICFRWTDAGAEDVEIVDYH